MISTRGKPKRKETPAEQSHLAWKAASLQPRGFFVTRIVIHSDGGVPAIACVSIFSGVTAFAVFFDIASVSNVAGIPVVTGF